MEIVDECYECILNRAIGILERSEFAKISQNDIIHQIKSATILLSPKDSWLINDRKIICPAQLGSIRQQYLEKIGMGDTYRKERMHGESLGKELISQIKIDKLTIDEAIMISLFGNGLEFDVGGNYNELSISNENNKLKAHLTNSVLLEKIAKISSLLLKDLNQGDTILFFLDNVGEHYLDSILIEILTNLGYNIEIVVKGKPVLNDVSLSDSLSIFTNHKIWSTENSDVGIFLKRIPKSLEERIHQSKLLIIKGMAQFETLSSEKIDTSALYLFKAKCNPIAEITKTSLGDFVIHYQPPGESWL